jgi:hypothetical protein
MPVSKNSPLAFFLFFLADGSIGFTAGGNSGVGVVTNNTMNRN